MSKYLPIFSILFIVSTHLRSQNVPINNIVATDITAQQDDILEIQFNDQLPNLPFVLAWIDKEGKQYAIRLTTGTEKLQISMGQQQGWQGEIGLVGLSMDNINVTIRRSDLADHWNTFMTKFPLSPGSVNFNGTYSFYGKPFRWICLGLMLVLCLLFSLKYRSIHLPLLLAFMVAWGIYDMRSMKNRWDIMAELADREYQIDIYRDLDIFLPKARDIIGDGSWTREQLSGVLNSYCTFHLADLTYKPHKSKIRNEADFIITHVPKKREVLLNEGRIYLVRNNQKK